MTILFQPSLKYLNDEFVDCRKHNPVSQSALKRWHKTWWSSWRAECSSCRSSPSEVPLPPPRNRGTDAGRTCPAENKGTDGRIKHRYRWRKDLLNVNALNIPSNIVLLKNSWLIVIHSQYQNMDICACPKKIGNFSHHFFVHPKELNETSERKELFLAL